MDILCSGIIVVDYRKPFDKQAMPDKKTPLRIVDNAVQLHAGGMSILAMACCKLGMQTGLMGCVGKDIAGYGLKGYLGRELDLNLDAVRLVDKAPTSSSFIRLSKEQRYIEHTPGASSLWVPAEKERDLIKSWRPKIVAIGYAGLLQAMDANGGTQMALWIKEIQDSGALAALDTHTVPTFNMLEQPAQLADIFFCNSEEGEAITGLSPRGPEKLVEKLWATYPAKNPQRMRILGLTLPHGVQIAYGNATSCINRWVANPLFGKITPIDLTGAGDFFRAGFYKCIINNIKDFRSGRLDLESAGRYAHQVSSAFISGEKDNSILSFLKTEHTDKTSDTGKE
jgi:sugar/nucleoside kinase (ribokinase family)